MKTLSLKILSPSFPSARPFALPAAALLAAIALSGCATAWRVDSEVQSFSSLPATAAVPLPGSTAADSTDSTNPANTAGAGTPSTRPVTFRFDRLPLQQATPEQQARQAGLEALALPALSQVGMVQDEAGARYNVLVSARLQQLWPDDGFGPRAGWWGPRVSFQYGRGGAWGPFYGGGFGHPGFYGYGTFPAWQDPAYQREVSVVMRDAATGQVVYETRASNLGRWPVDRDVLPLMFSAALSGFPQPPAGPRRVNVVAPRR